jgi:hypothetical protein
LVKASGIAVLLISISITIIAANYTYYAYLNAKQITDECFATKNAYIDQYGAVPKEYEHMCESTFGLFGSGK